MRKVFPVVLFFVLLFSAAAPSRPVFAMGQSSGQSGASPDMNTLADDVSSAFAQMDEALRPSVMDMTPEDEYYLGRAVAAEIIKVYKLYSAEPALTDYLNKICLAITVNSMKSALFSGYHAEILDTGEICAFSTPGGHIFISRGLIACCSSEDELAAVIAHEAAHIQLRHALTIIQNERTIQQLSAAAGRAAAIASRSLTTQERETLFRESVSSTVNILFQDGYSRDQEFEADKTARLLLISAGYDPAALSELLVVLEKTFQSGNMSNTHPSPSLRIASLGDLPLGLQGGMGRETLSARKARFNSIVGH